MIYTTSFRVPDDMLAKINNDWQLIIEWNIFSVTRAKDQSGNVKGFIAYLSTNSFDKIAKVECLLKRRGISYYTRASK